MTAAATGTALQRLDAIHHVLATRRAVEIARVAPSAALRIWADDAVAGNQRIVPWSSAALTGATRALRRGTITMLAGPKGASKSFFLTQQLVFWRSRGVAVAARFLEDSTALYLSRVLTQLDGTGDWTDPDFIEANPEAFAAAYLRHVDVLDDVAPCIEADDSGSVDYIDLCNWAEERVAQRCRVLVIDPVTAAAVGRDRYLEDHNFIMRMKRIIEGKASAVFVTHPKGDGTGMAGGQSFERFAHSIMVLNRNQDDKTFAVKDAFGCKSNVTPDRVWTIDKARNAPGTGARVAQSFNHNTLTFADLGIIAGAASPPSFED